MSKDNTLDEYGEVGDLSDVKLPPQAKGKLEYHSTPNKDKELEEQTAKAYGGCTKCYGKGYATWRHGESYRSRGVYASHNIRNDIKYCNCDRGKQLSSLIAQERRKAKIEEVKHQLNIAIEKDMFVPGTGSAGITIKTTKQTLEERLAELEQEE